MKSVKAWAVVDEHDKIAWWAPDAITPGRSKPTGHSQHHKEWSLRILRVEIREVKAKKK